MKKIICACLTAGFCIFAICGGKSEKVASQRHTVGYVNLRDVIVQTGEVRPVVKVELKSEASGRIDTVYVKQGQRVKKNDTVIVIDPSRLILRKKRLGLSVKKAGIERGIAKRDFDNAKKLMHTGTISERELSDIRSNFELADIAYNQQMLELKDVEDELSKTIVTSPMNGVVTNLDVEEGEIAVAATSGFSGGTSIATIADISRLEVVSQIGEVDYIHVQRGQKVIIRPEAISGAFTSGTIDFIALSATKQEGEELGTFEVRIGIDSLIEGITAGINVNVEFVIMEKENVLGIPNRFVTERDGKKFVLVESNKNPQNKLRPVAIKVGLTDYRYYEVLEGLKEADVVIFREKKKNGSVPRGRK